MAALIETLDDPWLSREACRLVLAAAQPRPTRYLLGIAGIGGAGKSTLAARLLAAVEQAAPGMARLVPMDGFHLANAVLDAWGLRPYKGAPQTFDAAGYIDLLRRLRDADALSMPFPVYDRALHEPMLRPGDPASTVDASIRLIITEGNYLLLDQPPWSQLADVLDECWLLETDAVTARQWIIGRHVRGGRSAEDAEAHYERTDLPNANLVMSCQRQPTRRVRWRHL
jgi:pantothenate kinase